MSCPDCARLEARVAKLELQMTAFGAAQAAGAMPAIASDAELDGPHGDPIVKKSPKRWMGRSFVGLPYSRTSPEFLDCLASFLDWCADREARDPAKAKYSKYSLLDASRARGHAARLRTGWKPPPAPPEARGYESSGYGSDDDVDEDRPL
jgi:hypothetical protein